MTGDGRPLALAAPEARTIVANHLHPRGRNRKMSPSWYAERSWRPRLNRTGTPCELDLESSASTNSATGLTRGCVQAGFPCAFRCERRNLLPTHERVITFYPC